MNLLRVCLLVFYEAQRDYVFDFSILCSKIGILSPINALFDIFNFFPCLINQVYILFEIQRESFTVSGQGSSGSCLHLTLALTTNDRDSKQKQNKKATDLCTIYMHLDTKLI